MSVLFHTPTGELQSNVVFSTTIPQRFFTGTVPDSTVDVLVSLRDGAYSSDPSLVLLNGTTFTVPNPVSFPNGLDLFSGENVIGVQAIPLVGTPGTPGTVTAYLLPEEDSDPFPPPTAITVERMDRSVRVKALGVNDSRVTGYNFYASVDPGGGLDGYTRLNVNPVTLAEVVETVVDLSEVTARGPAETADPLYLRALVRQETETGTILATPLDSRVQIPNTVDTVQVHVTLSSVETESYYHFDHDRQANESSVPPTIFVGLFASLPSDTPLYYVVTTLFYDPVTRVEYESYFSAEVVGNPIQVRIQTVSLPIVSRQQILQDAILSIYRQDNEQSVQPGAVIRDTFLDPFSTEAERVRFLLDFLYRASSFDTLLQIDDPNGTGFSVAPEDSPYKKALATAFFLNNPSDIQPVIDACFDKLAGNFGITRPAGKRAIGEVRFFTSSVPTRTLPIPLGTLVTGSGVNFRTIQAAELPLDRLASFYNPSTRQYSVTVPVQAVQPGSAGTLGSRQINSGAPYGFGVVNDAPTFGGKEAYSNTQLAALARGVLSSVDTGTTRGYLQVAQEVAGVVQAQVVRAGHPLMLRDMDATTLRHFGGKVDVWTQGLRAAQVSDTFAFTYVRKRDVQFVVVGDPSLYQFRSLDPDLSPANPLSQMLDYPDLGLGIRNASTGLSFDLTGVVIVNFNTIRLSTTVVQPSVTLTDVILGDYRYRTGDRYMFSRQPVFYISSVIGEVTGRLDPQSFYLVHPNNPLGIGRSTQAGDYLQVVQVDEPGVVTPTGTILSVTNEAHNLTGFYAENVFVLGADSLSVSVTDTTGMVSYRGPYDPSGTPDYDIVEGSQTYPMGIRRTQDSTIPDGGSVLISYKYDENFVVTYQINLVTAAVQAEIKIGEHACADALAKDAFMVPVDVTASVVLTRGAIQSDVDQAVRANLRYLVSNLRMGIPLRKSDVISTIGGTVGVSYVVTPLTVLARSVGSQVAQNDLASKGFGDALRINEWSTPSVATWLLKQELDCPTSVGGGGVGTYSGVFQDDVSMILQETTPTNIYGQPGKCYIIGDEGLNIPGYSDDATLISYGFGPLELASARRARTQNRVMVSMAVGDSPTNHRYWCTYVVGFSRGDQDILPTTVEYLVLGSVTFTYSEDKASA